MSELKRFEAFIIEDEEARQLLTMLLGKWGEPQSRELVEFIKGVLERRVNNGDTRLQYAYHLHLYNEVSGLKSGATRSKIRTAHHKMCDEAAAIFQSHFSLAIKMALLTTIKTVAEIAGDVPVKEKEKRIKALLTQEKRVSGRGMAEAFGIAAPLGRKEHYTKKQVVQDLHQAIRAVSQYVKGGKITQRQVAAVFYGVKPVDYKHLGDQDRRRYAEALRLLLTRKDLSFVEELKKAT